MVNVKSPALGPAITRFEISKSPVPLLVIVSVSGLLDVPFGCPPKGSAVGVTDIAGAVPVPVNETECVPAKVLSVIISVADSSLAVRGLKVTVTVALCCDWMANGVAAEVKEKSLPLVPETLRLLINREAVPVLVIVTGTG